MFGGDWASDMVTNGARNDAIQAQRRGDGWKVYANKMVDKAAEYAAMRHALAEQLAVYDPQNPLLKDQILIEKLQSAAVSTLRTNDLNFDAVREVGRTFKIPGRENPLANPAAPKGPLALKDDIVQLRATYAGTIALRDALSRQLHMADPENPLVDDIILKERIRSAGICAYVMNGNDFDSARHAGRTFQVPGREYPPLPKMKPV